VSIEDFDLVEIVEALIDKVPDVGKELARFYGKLFERVGVEGVVGWVYDVFDRDWEIAHNTMLRAATVDEIKQHRRLRNAIMKAYNQDNAKSIALQEKTVKDLLGGVVKAALMAVA
jgi:hypothetical protein